MQAKQAAHAQGPAHGWSGMNGKGGKAWGSSDGDE
jgi:hypothetical protein